MGRCVQRFDRFGQKEGDFNLALLRFFRIVTHKREDGHCCPSDLDHFGMANVERAAARRRNSKWPEGLGSHVFGNALEIDHSLIRWSWKSSLLRETVVRVHSCTNCFYSEK